jgi:hypothetical protein
MVDKFRHVVTWVILGLPASGPAIVAAVLRLQNTDASVTVMKIQ